MRIIYLGTPEFAVPPLESIINSEKHEVVAVVTQPDRPVGRKAIITPSPVKIVAQKNNIPILQFENIGKEGVEALKAINADAMVKCAYGQILTKEIIDICKFGIYNIHASLLPKFRGAAPIQYAVINGEKTTGITIMKTDVGLDTGDIVESFELPILKYETSGELAERLSDLASKKICEVLDNIESGNIVLKKQDDNLSSVVKTIKKTDNIIDFSKDNITVANFINGMNPWPIAQTVLNGKTIKIYRAEYSEGCGNVGEVLCAEKEIIVACGSGAIKITEIQEEGGKRLKASDYINGRKIFKGDILGK